MLEKLNRKLYKTENIDLKKLDITDDLRTNNIQILKVSSVMMMVIFIIMFLLSFIVENYKNNKLFYGFESLGTLATFISTVFFLPENKKYTQPFVYLFISLLYYYGLYAGVFSQKHNLAVTACLFLTVLPLLFIDDAVRLVLISFFAAIITSAVMIIFKDKSIIIIDLTDVIFSWIMGITLGIEINRLRISGYIREKQIAIERDLDGLTGLWNKNALVRKISSCISDSRQHGAFFIIDLDHFKELNDTFGHQYGDDILVKAAKCMKSVFCADGDILGRFGGDEFILYLPDISENEACQYAERLLYSFCENIKTQTKEKFLQCSIGIAMYSGQADMSYDTIMNTADQALYVTKKFGRFGYTVFAESDMKRRSIEI